MTDDNNALLRAIMGGDDYCLVKRIPKYWQECDGDQQLPDGSLVSSCVTLAHENRTEGCTYTLNSVGVTDHCFTTTWNDQGGFIKQ